MSMATTKSTSPRQMISLKIEQRTLAVIDEAAKRAGVTRTAYITSAALVAAGQGPISKVVGPEPRIKRPERLAPERPARPVVGHVFEQRSPKDCPHPVNRRIGTFCGECGGTVSSGRR